MAQLYPMEPSEQEAGAVADYRQQSRIFLGKAWEYLAEGDLHQASEKGWGAAAWMAKSVAEAQGWRYREHDEFLVVMYQAEELSGDQRLRSMAYAAKELHEFFYIRKIFLRPQFISCGLDEVNELLDLLQPLTE